jgi:peptidoglycan/LPS O-acetylase OafA/YrhL
MAVAAYMKMRAHIPELDGLRGIAVIAVVLKHLNFRFDGPFAQGGASGLLAAVLEAGWIGVDLFFVLSGFLITGILLDAKGRPGFFRNFYARRTVRIMPLYFGYLSAVVFLLPNLELPMQNVRPTESSNALSLFAYYYNFWVAHTERPVAGLHHFWSLAVEEHFYVVWPLIVWSVSRRTLVPFCAIGAAVSFGIRIGVVLSGAWIEVAYLITPCRLDGLLAGAIVAVSWRDTATWVRLRVLAPYMFVGSGALALGIALGQRHFAAFVDFRHIQPPVSTDSSLVVTLGIAALAPFFASALIMVLDAPSHAWYRRAVNSWILRSFGKYSYGIYVLHVIVLVCLVLALERFMPVGFQELPGATQKLITGACMLVLSFVVAFISYHLFERHFLRLKQFFEYRSPVAKPVAMSQPAPRPPNADAASSRALSASGHPVRRG